MASELAFASINSLKARALGNQAPPPAGPFQRGKHLTKGKDAARAKNFVITSLGFCFPSTQNNILETPAAISSLHRCDDAKQESMLCIVELVMTLSLSPIIMFCARAVGTGS